MEVTHTHELDSLFFLRRAGEKKYVCYEYHFLSTILWAWQVKAMAAYQYGSIPDQEGQYTQQFEPPPGYQPPPGYPSGGQPQQYAQTDVVNEAHPLHQPVNNSFDTRQQQGFYNQPLSNPQGYSQLPPYQNQGQVGFNPNGYAPAPATYQQQQQQQVSEWSVSVVAS